VVNWEMVIPLHSLSVLDLADLSFFIGLRPVYCIAPRTLSRIMSIFYSFWVMGIVVSFSISF